MKELARLFKVITVWLACLGWLLPIHESAAAESVAGGSARSPRVVYDVRLGEDGSFSGRLFDAAGKPLVGQTILLRQAGKVLARTQSGERGGFEFAGVRGGVYQVTINNSAVVCRAWTSQAAPPVAASQLAIVTQPDVVRGQQPISSVLSNPIFLGLIIAAAIAIPVAIHSSQDDAS
ncbi:MAG: carboxypeptidase regulatory-like domain-containing protein [Planctomycetes bacterium]|nr:carboxypeptidase regulatory-like domain-containing protein [Planctomycetota bacterium]